MYNILTEMSDVDQVNHGISRVFTDFQLNFILEMNQQIIPFC